MLSVRQPLYARYGLIYSRLYANVILSVRSQPNRQHTTTRKGSHEAGSLRPQPARHLRSLRGKRARDKPRGQPADHPPEGLAISLAILRQVRISADTGSPTETPCRAAHTETP